MGAATSPRMGRRRAKRPAALILQTDRRASSGRPATSLASGAAVHRPTAAGLTRRIRYSSSGAPTVRVPRRPRRGSRDARPRRDTAPTGGRGQDGCTNRAGQARVLAEDDRPRRRPGERCQLGHERPEHFRRTRTTGSDDMTGPPNTRRKLPHSSRGPGDAAVDVTPARSEGHRAWDMRRAVQMGNPLAAVTPRLPVVQAAGFERRRRLRSDAVARARATASR